MPRYELRNTATNERLYVEGTLPIDVAALVKNGTYRARAMSEEHPGDIVVDADAVIQTLSPADGALQVPIDANLVMTFTGAMKQQGTVELRNVGGALIESFDLASDGVWSSGDTVWTGNPAADFAFGTELCVRWSGLEDFKGNLLADNTGDTAWNFRSQSLGLTLLAQSVTPAGFATTHNFSVSATAGNTVPLVIAWSGTNALNSVTIDPGGANETVATIRTSGGSNGGSLALADVVWPATGSLTVRLVFASGVQYVALNAFDAKSLVHQVSSQATFAASSPQSVTQSINTTVGQSVVFAAILNTLDDVELAQGVDEVVGATQAHATRGSYVAKNDGVVGGTPQAFQLTWPDVNNVPGHGLLGVYA